MSSKQLKRHLPRITYDILLRILKERVRIKMIERLTPSIEHMEKFVHVSFNIKQIIPELREMRERYADLEKITLMRAVARVDIKQRIFSRGWRAVLENDRIHSIFVEDEMFRQESWEYHNPMSLSIE